MKGNRLMFDIKENLKTLPDKPGVYLHKNNVGEVIYVGKAVSLKNRVRQYFQSPERLLPKVRAMVSHIEEFEYITTDTEMEALILECNLIKKYMPKYNVLLRDDKTYPYIKVTLNEEWPRVVKTRRVTGDGGKYYGPYADAGAVNQIVDLLSSVYKLKRCSSQRFPEGHQPCLNYHIKECYGVCCGGYSHETYMEAVHSAMEFLAGRDKKLVSDLKAQMEQASEALEFEKAAQYRDYLMAIESIQDKQKVVLSSIGDLDVVLTAAGQEGFHVILFFVRHGKLSGRESFFMGEALEEDRGTIASAFIQQYYSGNTVIPKEILVEQELADHQLVEQWLTKLRGSNVKIFTPQKGDKKAILDLTRRDVVEMMKVLDDRARNEQEKTEALVTALNEFFGVERSGWRLEAYDISNTNGVDSVGAMVVFQDGKPQRRDYRRFKIKTVEGPNDYGSLQEVLYRRLRRAQKNDPGFSRLPDAIMMDGGKAQVSAVEQVLKAMKIDIPVAGMVKDDHHRTRGLVYGDKELELKTEPVLFKCLGAMQEEVHRFAIEYHRGLRNKTMQRSVLDEIEGVGEKRKQALLSHFGSIEKLSQASAEEIADVKGMNSAVAERIYTYFHNSVVKSETNVV